MVTVAAFSPASTVVLSILSDSDTASPIALSPPDDCQLVSQVTERDRAEAGQLALAHVRCDDIDFHVAVSTFSPRSSAAPIILERRRLTRPRHIENVAETAIISSLGESTNWRMFRSTGPSFFALAGVWIDGELSRVDFSMRIKQAVASVSRSPYVPALVVVSSPVNLDSVSPEARRKIEHQMVQFVLVRGKVDEQMRAATRQGRA